MIFNPYSYKNIIFDLGGVLLNIDYLITIEAFKALGLKNFDEIYSQSQQQKMFDSYERGEISTAQFRVEVNKLFGNKLSNAQIDTAWNALLLDFPLERLEILKNLKGNHRMFLLSNTNDLHIIEFKKILERIGVADFNQYFEKVYLSYKVGMRKPEPEIFELVLKENELKADETLFIDDSIQHIESAKQLGIVTYWLDIKKESIANLFI